MSGWRLVVWNASPTDPSLHRMGLRPTRRNPKVFVGFYRGDAKAQLLRHIELLKQSSLHGKAQPTNQSARKRAAARAALPAPRLKPIPHRRKEWQDAPYQRSYPELLAFAKHHRANPTDAEVVLWGFLSGSRIGVRARRQRVVAGYISDFYISAWRLCIEIDGSAHQHSGPYDARRDDAIEAQGFFVIRFPNAAVLENPQRVVEAIIQRGREISAQAALAFPTQET